LVGKTKTSLTGKALNSSEHHFGTSPLLLRLCYGSVFQEPEFVKNEIRKTFKRKDPEFE
jgi:hypothetical protein